MNTITKPLTIGDDREMILNGEDQWVHWPLLPVKRPTGTANGPDLGIIVAGMPTAVHLCNLFCFQSDAPTLKYPSVDALLAAGWIVD